VRRHRLAVVGNQNAPEIGRGEEDERIGCADKPCCAGVLKIDGWLALNGSISEIPGISVLVNTS
jgi:hypothetical protein